MARMGVILWPQAAYVVWLNGLDPRHRLDLEVLSREPALYLLPEAPYDEEELLGSLVTCYRELWDHELRSLCIDPGSWPFERSWSRFLTWFAPQFFPLVRDLGADRAGAP